MSEKDYEHKVISQNKKAYHDYFVLEKYEAGISLSGTEIKSIRNGRVNLKDSYCEIDKLEMFVVGMHISPYEKGNIFNKDPYRERKLLLHKKEILKLYQKAGQQGCTIVPLSIYFKGKLVKVEIGLCKGKKMYDKRETELKKQEERDIGRYEKNRD